MAQLIWDRGARSIESIAGDGGFRLTILPTSGGWGQSVVVAGLNSSNLSDDPNEIEHGFMVDGRRFCVVESGVRVRAWEDLPAGYGGDGAGVFRIYRLGGTVVYTVSSAPLSAIADNAWKTSMLPRWVGDDNDPYAEENEAFPVGGKPLTGWSVNGAIVHVSSTPSLGASFLDCSFSRDESDPYGELGFGEIYAAASIVAVNYSTVPRRALASLPTLRGKSFDTTISGLAYVALPALRAAASDLFDNRVRVTFPALRASATQKEFSSPFDVFENSVFVTLPALRAERPETKGRPHRLPILKAKAKGSNAATAALQMVRGHSGDNINLAYAVMPMFETASVGATPPQSPYGLVLLSLNPYIEMNGRSGDGNGSGEDSLPQELRPFAFALNGTFSSFLNVTVSGEPFVFGLSGSMRGRLDAMANIAPFVLRLTGSMDPSAEAVLQTTPWVFLLTGSLGGAPALWETIAEFDAGNDVFCMDTAVNTIGRTTQYKGFAFTSAAKIGRNHFGANKNGLFLLDGDADAGLPIDARFAFGQLDFGTPQVKTIAYCYMGTAAGGMRVNIKALLNGREASYTYPARAHGASMREVRFDFGRGLVSTYAQPTFYNTNGEYFEVDNVRFDTAVSARRI